MALTRYEIKGGVELLAVLGLIKRDGNVELQTCFGFLDTSKKFWMPLGVEAIR